MDPGSEVFEITDHTSATALEEFISTLEETFVYKWKLPQDDSNRPLERDELSRSLWQSSYVDIENIINFEYRLTLYRAKSTDSFSSPARTSHADGSSGGRPLSYSWKSLPTVDADRLPSYDSATSNVKQNASDFAAFEDLLSGKNEFVQSSSIRDCHALVDWFPMRMFIVITPLKSRNRILTETDAYTLNSCVLVALSNSRCSVPVFIQVSEPWRQMFRGLMLHGCHRVTFNTVHLRRAPEDCQHMSELLDNIFKEELGYHDVTQRPQIKIGLKFTYSLDVTLASSVSCSVENCILDAFQNSSQVSFSKKPASSPDRSRALQSSRLSLPIRALESPVYDALVSAIWPSVYADTVTESRSFTDLDPLQAPKWTCRLVLNDEYSASLYEIVRAFVERLQNDSVSSPRLSEYTEIYKKYLFRRSDAVQKASHSRVNSPSGQKSTTRMTVDTGSANMGERALSRITESRFQSSLRRIQNSGMRERLQYASNLGELLSHASAGPGNFTRTAEQTTASGIDYVDGAPIQHDLLMLLISFLFPRLSSAGTSDDASETNVCPYPTALSYSPVSSAVGTRGAMMASVADDDADTAVQYRRIKSAPHDSLPERLALVCALVRSGGTVGLFAFVWLQFLQELRYCYDNGIMIDGVAPGIPDQSTSLLHQKLQMLNYCIERRISGQMNAAGANTSSAVAASITSSVESLMDIDAADDAGTNFVSPASSVTSLTSTPSSTSVRRRRKNGAENDDKIGGDGVLVSPKPGKLADDNSSIGGDRDEFFDAFDDEPSATATTAKGLPGKADDDARSPEGRKERCENFSLLRRPDIPLYIPYTQEPACATDDMLAELVARLEAMGDSPESRARKACMQSESLYSDMQAFKAANPGCCLEDFVRWYSPRDLVIGAIGGVENDCRLSERMLIPGNTWSELWALASPRPISRQKRLFDETQQAERVLRDLYEIRLADAVQLLVPCLLTSAVHALAQRARAEVPDSAWRETCGFGDGTLKGLYAQIAQILRSVHVSPFLANTSANTMPSSAEGGLTLDRLTPVLDEMRQFERNLLRHHYISQRLAIGGALAGVGSENEQEHQALIASLHGGNEFEIVGGSQAPVARLFYQAFVKYNNATAHDGDIFMKNAADSGNSNNSLSLPMQPIRKEYVFKCWYGRPVASECQPGPQRLYVSYSAEHELRMMSAFSEDVSWS